MKHHDDDDDDDDDGGYDDDDNIISRGLKTSMFVLKPIVNTMRNNSPQRKFYPTRIFCLCLPLTNRIPFSTWFSKTLKRLKHHALQALSLGNRVCDKCPFFGWFALHHPWGLKMMMIHLFLRRTSIAHPMYLWFLRTPVTITIFQVARLNCRGSKKENQCYLVGLVRWVCVQEGGEP